MILIVPPKPKMPISAEENIIYNISQQCGVNGTHYMECVIQKSLILEGNETILEAICSEQDTQGPPQVDCTQFGISRAVDPYSCHFDCNATSIPEPKAKYVAPFGQTFWIHLALNFLAFNIAFPMYPLLYGMTFSMLGEKKHLFGKQRVWSSYGMTINSIITVFALNKYGGGDKSDITYTPCFIAFGVYLMFGGIVVQFFNLPNIERNHTMMKDFLLLVKQPLLCVLFGVLFVMGFLWGATETFLFWFLR